MALESWLTKVRSAVSSSLGSARSTVVPSGTGGSKKNNVGILSFEVASLMSKLLHMWRTVGDTAVMRLCHEAIALDGVRKVVSDDDAFLLGLACAELVDALRAASDTVAALAARCSDPCLRDFKEAFLEFADMGHDRHRWAMSWKEMEAKAKKMDRQVTSTAALHKAMEELSEAEHGLRKLLQCGAGGGGGCHRRSLSASKISAAAEQQQKIFSKKQEVKYLRQTSLWGCTFDTVVSVLARSTFTILARIKLVFGVGQDSQPPSLHRSHTVSSDSHPPSLHRSLTVSSTVYPSADMPPPPQKSMSMPVALSDNSTKHCGFLESNSAALVPPPTTLGAAALASRYANLVIVIERMVRAPRSVGQDARDDLYGMLTASVRAQLRARLRGVGYGVSAADAELAEEWRAALAGILEWLGPMAHATMRWQAERSFDQRKTAAAVATGASRGNVLLLQTLHFADREKVEAAIAELLVGLNYVWRFEKEMSSRALFLLHQELDRNSTNNINNAHSISGYDNDDGRNCNGGNDRSNNVNEAMEQ